MKITASILLLLVMLFHCSVKTILLVNFELNRDYIANTLCENKNKPSKHCNGKCFLRKEMEKQNKSESPFRNVKGKDVFFYYEFPALSICCSRFVMELSEEISPMSSNEISFGIFHPPRILG